MAKSKGSSGSNGYAKINANRKTNASKRPMTAFTSNRNSANFTPF